MKQNGVDAQINDEQHNKLTTKNLIMFSLGTFGRDFVYGLFAFQLLNYILFTKQMTPSQFGSITFIIVAARIFDAFNDPIMGGIVDNTKTKWGKFKPWQLIGAVLTGVVIIIVFCNNLQGNDFIILLAIMYFMFSISFTMNDISYWGMMPSLTSNEHDRSKLTSLAQLIASIGGAFVGILVPALTIGDFAIKGSAVSGYKYISIIAVFLMISFQLFTILGVKEKKLPQSLSVQEKVTLKQMFFKLAKNDQLMWSVLIMLIFSIGTGIVAGLNTAYIFFEYGYNGFLITLFGVFFAIASVLFTVSYPFLQKKFTRTKLIYATGFAIIIGYILILILGIAIPTSPMKTSLWYIKFGTMALANGVIGFGNGFYMIMVISMANTIEYNQLKTGKRDEGLIFSLRPFTAKLSSAIAQGIVTVVYLFAGVINYTNQISNLENEASRGIITAESKLHQINIVIGNISNKSKTILLFSMCLIPIICLGIAMLIYKKKYILDEQTYEDILNQLKDQNSEETNNADNTTKR